MPSLHGHRKRLRSVLIALMVVGIPLIAVILPTAVCADERINGVDFVDATAYPVDVQNSMLTQIKAAGANVIRFGFYEPGADKAIDLIKRAYAKGLKVALILHGLYRPDAPVRPYRPQEFPGMWKGSPFSSLDIDLSRGYFQRFLDKLDANGTPLASLELENEINMAGNNPDFSLPGEGRVLGLDDLKRDAEGQQVAKGLLQYLKVLTVLKEVRDHSKLNNRTPLLLTSLVDPGPEGPWPTPKNYDGVSLAATMAFFKANGVDRLVDLYNVHTYPWADGPGEKVSAIHRLRRLQQQISAAGCVAVGASGGKPCWVTEWGFINESKTCPSDERERSLLVKELMDDFREFEGKRIVTGLIYYSWIGEARFDVFRCNILTEPGRIALSQQ